MFGWIRGSDMRNDDGFVKGSYAALRFNFVVTTHLNVRLTPQISRALQLKPFTKPSLRNILSEMPLNLERGNI